MTPSYRAGLLERIKEVFHSYPHLNDYRHRFPWLTGALGDPTSGIWFVGENPSLSQVEKVSDPQGGAPTEEAQWWASWGDQLFRRLLVENGFKESSPEAHGGWRCYIINVIKEAEYAEEWGRSPVERRRAAAHAWAPVLQWELDQSRPTLIVALGNKVRDALSQLANNGMQFPRIERVHHYSYLASRACGKLGPRHPDRIREYEDQFASIAKLCRSMNQ